MAYKKITAKGVPKRSRLSVSRFEKTEEWRLMRVDMDKGLKADEALQVVLTEEDKQRYKIKNRRTVARFVKKYIESKNLPYIVKSFHRDDIGDLVIVQHSPRYSR
jgi:hypothetical protein